MAYERFSNVADILEDDLERAFANPYVIQEATLDQTVDAVSRVPARDRKLIIYTGVHPHERTTALAGKYAEEWQDKFGVLTVAQPPNLTPHGIWTSYIEHGGLDAQLPLDPAIAIEEDVIEDALANGDETFFIRFHGSMPKTDLGSENWSRKLDIGTSMFLVAPETYHRGVLPIRHSAPQIIDGLDRKLNDVEGLGYPGNVICVEYSYKGQPLQIISPSTLVLQTMASDRHPNGVPQIFNSEDANWWRKGNLKPEYLTHRIVGDADIEAFCQFYKDQIDKMLGHLAKELA